MSLFKTRLAVLFVGLLTFPDRCLSFVSRINPYGTYHNDSEQRISRSDGSVSLDGMYEKLSGRKPPMDLVIYSFQQPEIRSKSLSLYLKPFNSVYENGTLIDIAKGTVYYRVEITPTVINKEIVSVTGHKMFQSDYVAIVTWDNCTDRLGRGPFTFQVTVAMNSQSPNQDMYFVFKYREIKNLLAGYSQFSVNNFVSYTAPGSNSGDFVAKTVKSSNVDVIGTWLFWWINVRKQLVTSFSAQKPPSAVHLIMPGGQFNMCPKKNSNDAHTIKVFCDVLRKDVCPGPYVAFSWIQPDKESSKSQMVAPVFQEIDEEKIRTIFEFPSPISVTDVNGTCLASDLDLQSKMVSSSKIIKFISPIKEKPQIIINDLDLLLLEKEKNETSCTDAESETIGCTTNGIDKDKDVTATLICDSENMVAFTGPVPIEAAIKTSSEKRGSFQCVCKLYDVCSHRVFKTDFVFESKPRCSDHRDTEAASTKRLSGVGNTNGSSNLLDIIIVAVLILVLLGNRG